MSCGVKQSHVTTFVTVIQIIKLKQTWNYTIRHTQDVETVNSSDSSLAEKENYDLYFVSAGWLSLSAPASAYICTYL